MWDVLFTLVAVSIHGFAVLTVLATDRRNPSATLAWLLTVLFLPFVGVVLYAILGWTRARRIEKGNVGVAERVGAVLQKYNVIERLEGRADTVLHGQAESLLRLGRGLSSTPPSRGNHAEMLVDAAAFYESGVAAMDAAKDHLHVQFYIIQPDETGEGLREHLVAKAKEGVEVRVLVDGIGSMKLPSDFWEPLIQAGGEAAIYRPVGRFLRRFRRRDRVDFRNHRKIVVVDGRVGFTGGINIGREYLGLDPEMGQWRDTHIRIVGPAVFGLQKTFAEDWLAATGKLLDDPRYFPDPDRSDGRECVIQIVDSGPDRKWSPIAHIFSHSFALARDRIWITNPYFIPSLPIENSLISAALRGVDVRLLVPAKSDSIIVNLASQSYFPRLLDAGVRIFRYERGFVHAKTMVTDAWLATIGSANMDMRSFNLNYELNAFVLDKRFSNGVAEQFLSDLDQANEFTAEEEAQVGRIRRFARSVARLFSPLL
ncbi:MAG: cardiolipin synthase [Planctomycetota bacterium]|jgi:cardiolipin synthase